MNQSTGRNRRARSVSRIAGQLSAMNISGRRRSRSRSRSRSRPRQSVTFAQVATPRRKPRKKAASVGMPWQPMAHFMMAKEEILCTIGWDANSKPATTEVSFTLVKDDASKFGASHLLALSQCFEMVRWDYVEITYVPEVGSTVGGAVSIGVDWDQQSKTAPSKHADITVRSPNMFTQVWQGSGLRINPAEFTNKRWFKNQKTTDIFESTPFTLACWLTGEAKPGVEVGALVLKYRVEFAGTRLN